MDPDPEGECCVSDPDRTINPLVLDFLRNIYFFHTIPESSLRKIGNLCQEKRYDKDAILFFEDMPGDCFFIVIEGELEIWKRYGQPDGVLLNVTGAGQPLGEMALIDEQPRSATVKARTPVRAYVIQATDFNNLLLTDASICVSLLKAITMMVRRSNEAHIIDLDRQNKELSRAYRDLQALQDELVRRERLSVIGKFSSLILHDIRNPLSALKSRVELLKENLGNEVDFEDSITRIKSDISRMEALAAEFLDYARGDIRLQMSVCSVASLLERFRDVMASKLERFGITLSIRNEVSRSVILDADRILRVLINAGENACKAMPNGGLLEIVSRIETNRLLLDISDTGHGMTKEFLDHIFEPFHSASVGGTGLGMVIIKSIVEAHKGSVVITSEMERGTTVSISLPVLA